MVYPTGSSMFIISILQTRVLGCEQLYLKLEKEQSGTHSVGAYYMPSITVSICGGGLRL